MQITEPVSHLAVEDRWRALALIAAAQIGAMSTWFSAAAVAPALSRDWHLAPPAVALLTVAVQVGFVAGALAIAVGGISDVLSCRTVFTVSALIAAAANGLSAAAGGELRLAVPLRVFLGVALAGVYPTGMKLMAGWFREGRGLAIGILVGALTLGAAFPHLVAGLGVTGAVHWQVVFIVTSLAAVVSAATVAWFVRSGPFEAPSARLDLTWAVRSLRDPALRLANLGYFGHMWELYAMWTWIPVFLLASFQASGLPGNLAAGRSASIAAAGVIGIGALGCVAGGLVSDRIGRTLTSVAAMALSGTCAAVTGFLFAGPPTVIIAVTALWGISVIADSAQFSASISELAEPQRVGSALALQTALGFLLTAISIQVLPWIQKAAGWSVAFAMLAVGPALGAAAMLRLRRRPEAARLAGGRR